MALKVALARPLPLSPQPRWPPALGEQGLVVLDLLDAIVLAFQIQEPSCCVLLLLLFCFLI